jgi:TPR repeat protein
MEETQSYNQATVWLRKAARQGHVQAQYNLGVAYVEGRGVEDEPPERELR